MALELITNLLKALAMRSLNPCSNGMALEQISFIKFFWYE